MNPMRLIEIKNFHRKLSGEDGHDFFIDAPDIIEELIREVEKLPETWECPNCGMPMDPYDDVDEEVEQKP